MIKVQRIGVNLGVALPRTLRAVSVATARLPLKVAALYARPALVDEIKHRLAKDPTGALARSVQTRFLLTESRQDLSVAVAGSKLIYAEIQDQGGEILPTRRYLAVPVRLPRAMRGKWPRDWPSDALTLIRSRKGNLLLVEMQRRAKSGGPRKRRRGKAPRARFIVRYVLRERVRLRGVRYVAAALDRMRAPAAEYAQRELQAIIDREARR